jgi:hypothetical protein
MEVELDAFLICNRHHLAAEDTEGVVKLIGLTLLPLPFAWHLPIDKGDPVFSIKIVKKGMARSSCSTPVRARCGGRKDEGSAYC